MRLAPFALLALACIAAAPAGPDAGALAKALALYAARDSGPNGDGGASAPALQVRRVGCKAFDEEPTEFACTYEAADPAGKWTGWSTVVAADGGEWTVIDEPSQQPRKWELLRRK